MFRLLSLFIFFFLLWHDIYSQEDQVTDPLLQPKEQLIDLWNQGYIFSTLDSLDSLGDGFYKGQKYRGHLAGLFVVNQVDGNKRLANTNFMNSINAELESHLDQYANNGFPFVRLTWDSIRIRKEEYLGYLTLNPGPEIRYDSLIVLGSPSVSSGFMAKVVRAEKGDSYSEDDFRRIPDRLMSLDYLSLTNRPDVTFEGGKAVVYLPLKQTESNTFEGVLGVFPGQSPKNQLAITGYINLDLVNLFRTGKSLRFEWNRFSNESQSVDLDFKYPFIFGSRLFLQGKFNLLKQDTTFLNQSWEFTSGTPLTGYSEFHFGISSSSGSLISPTVENINNGISDYELRQYFVGVEDIRYGKSVGWEKQFRYRLQVGIGDKEINKNPNLDLSSYDSLNLETQIFRLKAEVEYQLVFGKAKALYHEVRGFVYANDQVLQNELERLGGLKSIRGFNENFFYSQHYVLNRIEMRQYFDRNTYVSAFGDQLFDYHEDRLDFAQGYGFGISLETTNGLFSFAAALGISRTIVFDPSNIKIHLGYISVF